MAPSLPIPQVMRTLARAIEEHELPAVEKIANARHAFHVLIGTLLSARTQDATTHAASERSVPACADARRMAALSVAEIERLIYPVSFYRNKAEHVKETCSLLLERFEGRVPGTMEELLTLPGVGTEDREPRADPGVLQPQQHLRGHARPPDLEPAWLGAHEDARADRAGALPRRGLAAGGRTSTCTWSSGARTSAGRSRRAAAPARSAAGARESASPGDRSRPRALGQGSSLS